ncbi:MAG TPA: UDP-N-acetylmuramoyl-tripeptide--D-alanyl-D-alanine ligase, partial [Pyrinomonadaceae bacterium]|nr:UDP-N-acetylmuramoyl-tripeptide--D-alanyl-D-alanine ligase [Pyrinomonadaceae bacterium]
MNTRDAARLMRARFEGGSPPPVFDKEIRNFSVDSRSVGAGELFFAMSPDDSARHFFTAPSTTDAHEFIPEALERGAAACVARAEHFARDERLRAVAERLLLVEDVIEALQRLARGVIDGWGRTVVAITGSSGKTTTKDLAAHVLGATGRRVVRSRKNFNNELGVPLSVLQMVSEGSRAEDFDAAVIEMGMSMPGEIARLCEVAPPDIGVELLVAPVHLEFFGSIERIAEGKAQLVEGIKPGGTAVLNADDPRVAAMRSKLRGGGTVLTFGVEQPADVSATEIESAGVGLSRFTLRTPGGSARAELPMPGRHNVMNALAAAAVATRFGLTPGEIAEALQTAAPSEMRGEVLRFAEGFAVVDDSYNSNPRSLVSMTEALVQGGGQAKRRIIVAGEMLELGPEAALMHREAGREIAGFGGEALWGVRGLARELVGGAREAGMS